MHHAKVTHQNARELKVIAIRKDTSVAPRRGNTAPRAVNAANPTHVHRKTGTLSSTATPVGAQGKPRIAHITATITAVQQTAVKPC
mmetsp:Transcript_49724/g.108156  ORF Transcript_49724/g.108156 Transcript_49724/m.108156 type:complete len:86 (+) Transcript_49724:90-347(+)